MPDVDDQTATAVGDEAGGDKSGSGAAAVPDGDGKDTTASGKEGDGGSGKVNVEDILEEFGLESPEELKDWLANFKDLKGQIGDADFEEILESHETLKTYQKQWAADERAKLKDKETPEETIARLEKEKEELESKRSHDREQAQAAKAAKAAIEGFSKTVTTAIEADADVPKSWRPFVSEFMGVDNPINEVDIEDRAAVRKLTKAGIKKMVGFANLVIKEYRDGKVKIPSVASSQVVSTEITKDKAPKNLRESRRLMHESLSALINK